MKRLLWKASWMFVLTVLAGQFAVAQDAPSQGSSTPEANVVLGGGTGSPGSSVAVPLYVRPPEGTEIGQLKLQVTFVSVNLKYGKIEPGITAEMGNITIETDTSGGTNEKGVETTTLTITATASGSDNSAQGIPPGLLLYIMLNIDEKGRPATIALRTKLEAREQGTNKLLPNVTTADSTVEVVAPGSEPSVTCFFFTH